MRLLTDAGFSEEFEIVETELVDQYLKDELSPEERTQFERNCLETAGRRDKLTFAAALNDVARARARDKCPATRPSPRGERPGARRLLLPAYLKAAAVIVIASGLGLGAWLLFARRPAADRDLAALNSAYKGRRLIEARVAGIDYAPLMVTRGPDSPGADEEALRREELRLLTGLDDRPGAEAHHALGRFYLAGRQFDKAIDQFEAALKFDSQKAQLHSDLGAALLERGRALGPEPEHGRKIEEFARSLRHLDKALELDGSLMEPLFNRALLYREMGLPEQAAGDWRQYLERDPNSVWADEARQRLTELERRRDRASRDEGQSLQAFLKAYEGGDDVAAWEVIRRSYTSGGNAITNALLDSYLDLEMRGEGGAAADKLEALAYAARLEFQRAGDTYTSDLARFYGGSNPRQRRALARARAQMRKGYELFLRSNLNDALGLYAQAKQTFDESGDACEATFAEYRMGHCYLLQPDLKRSEAIFARLRPACERSSYKWLLNQSLYRTASIRFTLNEYSESIDYARRALKQSEQMGDTVGVLNTLVLLSDQYRTLNDERQSLGFLQRALTLTGEEGAEPLQAWGIFTAIGLDLDALGLHPAALEYQREALRLALRMEPERPLIISRSYDYLGLTYASLKDYGSALRNIDLASEAGRRLAAERSGLEMMANSSLHAGDVYRQAGDYAKAVESYDRSIRLYEELDYPYFTYPARKGKLLSYIAGGDDSAAEAELKSVLEIFEQYRARMTSESQRNTFFDVEQSVYDLAIDFAESRKHDSQLAFEYSELSRARSLLDAMRRSARAAEPDGGPELHLPSTTTPLPLSEIQQRMPEQSQVVQYAALDDKLIIWVVTRASVSTREVPIGSRALGEKVQSYLRAVGGPAAAADAEAEKGARELYDLLLAPAESLLDRTKLLCVVPDKVLHYVPFAALVSTGTGRYLVEDFRVEVAPSSTIFVDCSEQAGRKAVAQERLLSVGDPSFDGGAFPSLPRLPSAAREAEAVTAFYSAHRLLLRDGARERAVRGDIAQAEVAHFALHYLVDERSSQLSKMVLAPGRGGGDEEDDDGAWRTHEIYKMKLPRTRLVVLSACQTGIEQQYRGEGAVSIARPFIAAGVPLVVASLWPVDSQSTERLMVSFHRHRTRDRLPTAEALRRAQLELLGGDDSRYRRPYYWAAFTAIGGYTEY